MNSWRPSGWFRLWVFVGALYALFVAGLVALSWPQPESGIKTYEAVVDATGEKFEFDFYGYMDLTGAELEAILLSQKLAGSPVGTQVTPSSPQVSAALNRLTFVEDKGRETVWVKATSKTSAETAVKRLREGPWPERRSMIGWAALGWAGPLVFVYAVGWGVGWVIRGFRKGGPAA